MPRSSAAKKSSSRKSPSKSGAAKPAPRRAKAASKPKGPSTSALQARIRGQPPNRLPRLKVSAARLDRSAKSPPPLLRLSKSKVRQRRKFPTACSKRHRARRKCPIRSKASLRRRRNLANPLDRSRKLRTNCRSSPRACAARSKTSSPESNN